MLVAHFVTINPWQREGVARLTKSLKQDTDIGGLFGRLAMKLAGAPRCFDLYLTEEELIAAFFTRYTDPAVQGRIQLAIDKATT